MRSLSGRRCGPLSVEHWTSSPLLRGCTRMNDLHRQASRAKASSSHGLNAWRPSELKYLPKVAWRPRARFLPRTVDLGRRPDNVGNILILKAPPGLSGHFRVITHVRISNPRVCSISEMSTVTNGSTSCKIYRTHSFQSEDSPYVGGVVVHHV